MRSLYSGVSGLTTHQQRMDVIGNNLANVNTTGFKASRYTFRDIYYQTAQGATSGRATYAGNNPSQVGYGVQMGSIDKDMSMSNFMNTNRATDLAIAGDGFFMTSTYDSLNLSSDKSASSVKYTRMGAFFFDNYGNLVANPNVFIVGSRNTLAGLLQTGDESLNSLNNVEVKDRDGDGRINASDITYRNTINVSDLMKQAYNIYTDEFGFMYRYDWDKLLAEKNGDDFVFGPDSSKIDGNGNVTDANGLVVYDLKAFGGTADELAAITDPKELEKYIDVQQTVANFEKALTELSSDDVTVKDDIANVTDATSAEALVLKHRHYVDKTGQEITLNKIKMGKDTDATDHTYAELYCTLKFEDTVAGTGDVEKTRQTSKNYITSAGGLIGELTYKDAEGVDIGKDGVITITYNGTMKSLARIELAVFDNPDGLAEDGDTQFAQTAASGEAGIKRAGIDPGMTETAIVSNRLEMSNVNLAQEFSDMIVTQRGFQANARIITTSDSMLEELVNLKR